MKNKPILIDTPEGLSLEYDGMILCPDFSDLIKRTTPGLLESELIVKAAKFKGVEPNRNGTFKGKGYGWNGLCAVDMTAGLGEDSFLLAAYGFNMTLYEKDPIIAALLKDTVNRAKSQDWEGSHIAKRMNVIEGNSIYSSFDNPPDLVYLDPMFPERRKSGLIKKKFQILQQLESPCENEEELLEAAIGIKPRKIIIKRPLKAPDLGGVKPSYSIKGSVVRYDCIVL